MILDDPLQRRFEQLKLKYGREALSKIFINLLNKRLYERRADKATNHKARRQAGNK